MLDILYTCWHIIQYVLYGIFALFHIEEAIVILLKSKGVPIWVQIVLLLPFNTIVIAIEVLLFRQIRRLRKIWCFIKKLLPMRVRQFFNFLAKLIKQKISKQDEDLKNKVLGCRTFFLLGFIQEGQKFGSATIALLMKELSWQEFIALFKEFISLCFGGACRLTIYILIINTALPEDSLLAVAIAFISLIFISWLIQKIKKTPQT